jgi:hypothetical protein
MRKKSIFEKNESGTVKTSAERKDLSSMKVKLKIQLLFSVKA